MIRSIIVEDEIKSMETLKTLLERYCDDVIVEGTAGSVQEAMHLIEMHTPELVFLDINMPGGNGFDLLKKYEDKNFEVIFITAYDEYAIQAIKVRALDYLLKPLNIAELQQAVARARQHLMDKKSAGNPPAYAASAQPVPERSLAIPVADGIKFVPLHQVIHLDAKGSYTEICCETGNILSSRPLKEYENKLPPAQFFRTHHSHIINLAFIKHYHRGDGGYVTMSDGSVIDISKRRKAAFLELFQV